MFLQRFHHTTKWKGWKDRLHLYHSTVKFLIYGRILARTSDSIHSSVYFKYFYRMLLSPNMKCIGLINWDIVQGAAETQYVNLFDQLFHIGRKQGYIRYPHSHLS